MALSATPMARTAAIEPGVALAPRRRSGLNKALLGWFDANRRDLVFRRTRDPYAVLVAEVMLQQTQATRVEPAWEAFMARFPSVAALAGASTADVIRAWAGLGYYGRAVRLHRAARGIVARYAGVVPNDLAALERLPGIGPYTARAIAATAFDRRVAPVDTNVGRVVGRVFGVPPGTGTRAVLQRLGDAWIQDTRPAEWTHAAMDLGATICTSGDPACARCPIRRLCASAGSVPPATRLARGRSTERFATPRFAATRRWLRGRMVAQLSSEPDGSWIRIAGPIGLHPSAAVESALVELEVDGVIERDPIGRARLPQRVA